MKKPTLDSGKVINTIFGKLAGLSKAKRLLIGGGIVLLLIIPVILKLYLPKHEKIEELTKTYHEKSEELKKYEARAKQKKKLEAELKELKDEFDLARKALPEDREIPELLTSITNAGQDSGLEFILFEPDKEKMASFYAEIPIAMEMSGKYQEAVAFFEKVSNFPRIVNAKDVKVIAGGGKRKGKKKASSTEEDILNITCTAVTYKFVETQPEPEKKTEKKGKKGTKKN